MKTSNNLTFRAGIAASFAALLAVVGCAKPSDPAPLADAVAQLQTHAKNILEAFENETPGEAHDALHQVGGTLKAIPEYALKAGVAPDETANITDCVNQLFDSFGQLDKTLHQPAGEASEIDLGAISWQVQTAIATLESYVPESMRQTAVSNADGEGHHEGDADGHDSDEGHDGHNEHDGHDHSEHE